jgi:hypothetical protein
LNNASKLLYHKDFRKALSSKYGDSIVWREIDKGLKDIAGLHDAPTSLERLILAGKNKVVTNVFGLNPFIIMIQPLSYPMYWSYVPAEWLLQGQFDFWSSPKKQIAWLNEISPEFRERISRGFNKDLAELSQKTSSVGVGAKSDLAQKLTGGIRGADLITVSPGMLGGISFVLDNFEKGIVTDQMRVALDITKEDIPNLTPEAKLKLAVRYGEFATNLTQPNFQPEHRSPISRGKNVFEVGFSVFGSFTNRVYSQIHREMGRYKRAKTTEEKSDAFNRVVKVLFLAFVVQTAGMLARDEIRDIAYGRKDKNKNIPLRILKAWSGYVFGVRDIVGSAVSKAERGGFAGYDVDYVTETPIQLMADLLTAALVFASDASKKKRDKAALRLVDLAVELLFLRFGLPYQNIKNLGKIAETATKPKTKGIKVP